MREIRQSGSEGGEPHPNAASLPLSGRRGDRASWRQSRFGNPLAVATIAKGPVCFVAAGAIGVQCKGAEATKRIGVMGPFG